MTNKYNVNKQKVQPAKESPAHILTSKQMLYVAICDRKHADDSKSVVSIIMSLLNYASHLLAFAAPPLLFICLLSTVL